MPGSEYYDRDETPQEIEQRIRWKRKERENWENMLVKLYALSPGSNIRNNKFDAKLDELMDFVKARIQEIRI